MKLNTGILLVTFFLVIHVSDIVAKEVTFSRPCSQSIFLRCHRPIIIEGDTEFTKDNGVVSGNGTKSNPFIIEDWFFRFTIIDVIHDNYGIYIKNTSSFFIVRNCHFTFVNGRISFIIDN